MVTHRQIRAARGLLGWSQQQLADRAIVSLAAVSRLEKGLDVRVSTLAAIVKALTRARIEFLPGDANSKNGKNGRPGEGVRFRRRG